MKKGKKFFLVFYGHSCGGKSSVVELLISRNKNIFRASQDRIKWLIPNYYWKDHSDIAYRLLIKLIKGAVSEGFSIVCEGSIQGMKNKSKDFKLIAKKNDMAFFEFNIESPFELVKERFKKRVKEAKMGKGKIANKSLKRLKELYNTHEENKNEKAHTFDSSVLSLKEIVKEIEKIIQINP